MVHLDTEFEVVTGNARSQAASMTLGPSSGTGGPDNRHRGSDQWLYVVAGRGKAIVEREEVRLEPGSLILIERGEAHEIRCGEGEPLQTLNFYVPPAYSPDGDELPSGES